jgi:hypothetical protein
VAEAEWTCEWRIPFAALGVNPAAVKRFLFNLGAHHTAGDLWTAWVGTSTALFHVDKAGDLFLE